MIERSQTGNDGAILNESKPLIGITTYGRNQHNQFCLPANYVEAVRRAGGIPVLIPAGEPHVAALLERLDGLILAGGGDIDPELYQGTRHETLYMIDPERDATELALARQVAANGKPTLGICRGIQVINVALGGTLIEHLPDEVNGEIAHRNPPPTPADISSHTQHELQLTAESRLAHILEVTQLSSASWHHQALRRVARELQVVAQAEDGTVEAVELPGHPWLIAVQWHPEITAGEDPVQQRLFDLFVQAAQGTRGL